MAPTHETEEFDTAPPVNWSDIRFTNRSAALDVQPRPIDALKVLQDAGGESPTLTKAELVDLLFEHVGLNKREAKDMVESFFVEIGDALERGESVRLAGFGSFQLRDKVSRLGRNPKTGEDAPIPARRVVIFRASEKLKSATDETTVASLASVPERLADTIRD